MQLTLFFKVSSLMDNLKAQITRLVAKVQKIKNELKLKLKKLK